MQRILGRGPQPEPELAASQGPLYLAELLLDTESTSSGPGLADRRAFLFSKVNFKP
jgi:hypothetical protein